MANFLRALRKLFPAPLQPIGFFHDRTYALDYARFKQDEDPRHRQVIVAVEGHGVSVYRVGGL